MSEEQEVFKFAVTAGLKPGDVVRARTPAGIRVEVTIPPGALPGDVVQFVLPSAVGGSDVGGAGGATLEEKVDGPTLVAKIKSEEKINVRDVNQAGVSNAAPKVTFSIMVPLDTKAGQTLVAELPDGQRVVVTVPASAKPGRDLFFRVPAGGPDAQVVHVSMKCAAGPAQPTPRRKAAGVTRVRGCACPILTACADSACRGFMKKKSPKGIKGFHAWQMRWFELTTHKLAYWEVSMEGAVDEKGGLPLTDLVGVRKHVKDGERLDLLLGSKRLFQLCAPSNAERDEWAIKLQAAMVAAMQAAKGGSEGGSEGGEALSTSELGVALNEASQQQDVDESTVEDKGEDAEDEAGDKGEMLEQFADMARTVSKMPKKEHDAALDMVKTIDDRDSKDDDSAAKEEVVLEVAQEAPVQTAVYMSRVQRAKRANAARTHAK